MTGSLLVLLAVSISSPGSTGLSEGALLTIAEQSFAEGISLRHDSDKARPAFARSAIAYDELWQRGFRNPELTLNRAHAHQLSGNLPLAIAALHEGLAVARWNRSLQVALEEARSSVGYPLTGDLSSQCRPTIVPSISSRMSPVEAWGIAALLWILVCVGIARFAMTRAMWWLMFAALATVALAILGSMWLHDYRQMQSENETPLLIVKDDVYLRRGNSREYPARLEARLPRGVEVRELSRRGGWLQVRLASGIIGWLPETAVLGVGVNMTEREG
jgi:hypothetical protein